MCVRGENVMTETSLKVNPMLRSKPPRRLRAMKIMAACGFVASILAANIASSEPLARLRIAVGQRGVAESEVAEVGQKQNIFQKHGLDLEVFYTSGSGETIQTVISRSADIGVSAGLSGALGAYSKGAPIRVIGSTMSGDSSLYWYVRADSAIRAPEDVKGKTVAYSTNGSSTHNVVLRMQTQLKVPFTPVATGGPPGTFTQVMTGQIDVGWSGAPFMIDELEKGRIRTLWRATDIPALKEATTRIIVASADLTESRFELVEKFLDAYRETIDFIYKSPQGASAYAEWAQMPVPVAERALKEFLPYAAVNPDRIIGLQDAMQEAVELKFMPKPLDADEVATFIRIPKRR